MRRVVAALALAVVVSGAAGASASIRNVVRTFSTPRTIPLQTALFDQNLFTSAQQGQAFSRTRNAGATSVLLIANWAQLAPTAPASSAEAADPDWPGYDWAQLDAEVAHAEAAGLTPILEIFYAPPWALAVPRSGRSHGTPSVSALGLFAHALATHFDGEHGAPNVHVYEIWNEPNLSLYLSPPSPTIYREMIDVAAAAIHRVSPANLVVAGALDPFKNRTTQWHTIAPLAFMRELLCVSGGLHPHATCKARVHFDVWSHHPYTFGGPFGRARLKDDVSLGNLPAMAAVLRAALRLHRIVSSHRVQFWVTEFAWDTRPPNRHAMSITLQARATAEALHQMWLSGVSLATWYLLQDRPLSTVYQCGLYFGGKPIESARPKPTLTAFRFPFVAYLGATGVSIWGRDATSSPRLVTIQLGAGSRGPWRTVAMVRTNRYGIFVATLPVVASEKDWLRARAAGSGTSLAFSLTQPRYPRIGPWGN